MVFNRESLIGIYDSSLPYPSFWTFSLPASGNTLNNFSITYTSSKNVRVLWGDGTNNSVTTQVVTSHNYGNIKTGLTLVPFDINRDSIFSKIICGISSPALSGTVNIAPYSNLTFFSNTNNNITGFTGSQNLSGLLEIYLNNNSLSGNIPTLTNNNVLSRFEAYNNKYTNFSGNVSNTLDTFRADSNLLTTTAVNNILAAFVSANRTTGNRVLNLGGSGNAAPTGQGLIDKSSLLGVGWTVTTN